MTRKGALFGLLSGTLSALIFFKGDGVLFVGKMIAQPTTWGRDLGAVAAALAPGLIFAFCVWMIVGRGIVSSQRSRLLTGFRAHAYPHSSGEILCDMRANQELDHDAAEPRRLVA
jgi:hypothetical protein